MLRSTPSRKNLSYINRKRCLWIIFNGKDIYIYMFTQFMITALKMAQAWVETFENINNGSVEILANGMS